MALIDEIKGEILQQRGACPAASPTQGDENPKPKRTRQSKEMTDEEREAYILKKQAEEEARYLGKSAKGKRRGRKPKIAQADEAEKAERPAKVIRRRRRRKKQETDVQSVQAMPMKSTRKPRGAKGKGRKLPKVLSPLEPLYLLRIPGLPKGDCIAICYARGADA